LDNSKMLIDAVKPYYSFHADVADLTFTKQGIGPRYALVVVDLFSSFIWTYGMKKKSQLYDKLVVFYHDIENGRDKDETINIQTDREFEQNKIKELNKKNNVNMFSTKINMGHAVAAEQKIKMLKQKYVQLDDVDGDELDNMYKRDKYKLLVDFTKNINTQSEKYPRDPIDINKDWIEGDRDAVERVYNHYRLERIKKRAATRDKLDAKAFKKEKPRPLNVGDLVLIPTYRLKKSDALAALDKATTRKKEFFSRKNIFVVENLKLYKSVNNVKFYYYLLSHYADREKFVNGKFKRNELYKINI